MTGYTTRMARIKPIGPMHRKPTSLPRELISSYSRDSCWPYTDIRLSELDSECRHRAENTDIRNGVKYIL